MGLLLGPQWTTMILCIDTATANAGVTLIGDDQVLGYLKLDATHASDQILEKIDQLIQKADIQLSELKGVFIIKGPGSFTGLRVGIAVANQFAHQLKIPIIGLRTEEWYQYRTDEKDFIYLQSMNRDQVYMVGFGKYERDYPQSIIPISECHYELASKSDVKWLGQASDEHRQQLSDIKEITDCRPADETWLQVVRNITITPQKTYELIEPFYGKEPTITKSKKKIRNITIL